MFCLWEVRRPRFAFSDPKRERYTWSPQKGLNRVGYTWWATHGLFFLPFLKDVCSKTMCRPPCVALPFVTFRRMSAGKTMCSPLPFDQRREGYTWWSTHGLFFLPFLKDVCSKTMCRPPCVALPSLVEGVRATHGLSADILRKLKLNLHFRRMSAGKTMCSLPF